MRRVSRQLLSSALEEYNHGAKERPFGEHCYRCHVDKLSRELASCFVPLGPDEETQAFLHKSQRRSGNICLQLLFIFLQAILGLFLSNTAVCGLLQRGKMFVFSRNQLTRLLPKNFVPPSFVLDIGSGDGHVTEKMSKLFGCRVHVTETCSVMQRILRKKGYHVVDANRWHLESHQYELISCLNVLDRCDCPLTMLRQIHGQLQPDGLLILALVLPFEPFIERGPRQATPTELLPLRGEVWEDSVCNLWEAVLKPLGFSLVSLSRLPYLCEGDLHGEFYYLDDVVMVLRKTDSVT